MTGTLYEEDPGAIRTDGRDIDPRQGALTGEASNQRTAGPALPVGMPGPWEQLPTPAYNDPTYYDRPVLKEPVWKPYIPLYYFIGGAAGASLALGAAAQLAGARELDRLVRRCHWMGIIGSGLGGALLVADLGRPERFLMMVRVFRPTSPMNMGAWVLTVAPSAAFTAGLFVRRNNGFLRKLGEVAGYSSGAFGLVLATYTGVLVANSAIPVWQQSRRVVPILFGSSAIASAASIFDLLYEDDRACRITRKYGIIGRVAELGATVAMERAVSEVPRVGRPLKNGVSGLLWRVSTVMTAGSLMTLMLPKQNRKKRVVAGVLGALGSLTMRFAVHYAGVQSARDPRAAFHEQRAGRGGTGVNTR